MYLSRKSMNISRFWQWIELKFWQWIERSFRSSRVVFKGRRMTAAWSDRLFTLPAIETAHSEEEMLLLKRNIGDHIFRTDLRQVFLFIGDNPGDVESYFPIWSIFGGEQEEVSSLSYEQSESGLSVIFNAVNCKFYHGGMEIRCAVRPNALTCHECLDFELKRN